MKRLKPLWISLTSVFGVLAIAAVTGYFVTDNFSAAINMHFNTKTYQLVDNPDAKPEYPFRSEYDFIEYDENGRPIENAGEDLFDEDKDIISLVEEEGAVLLWNHEKTLPLRNETTVSLLGRGSQSIVETGSGSGWIPSTRSINLKDAFNEVGVECNPTLWDFYSKQAKRTEKNSACEENATLAVNETAWSKYDDATKNSFAAYGDAAIVVLSRTGGEYADLDRNGTDSIDGSKNYLLMTKNEKDLLDNVLQYKASGVFKKVILLFNSGNPFDMEPFKPYFEDIDAAMYIGEVGTSGATAVARLIVGEASPSGHLTDTWAYHSYSAPAAMNSGDYRYQNAANFKDGHGNTLSPSKQEQERQIEYMVYQEGIYVGYRYYETRYEDYALGRNYADSTAGSSDGAEWRYEHEVAFPFGHGESYGEFVYSDFDLKKVGNDYEASITIKNVGEYPAKAVAQFYLQKPYTSFDENAGLEKSAVELASFSKTKLLSAGQEQRVTARIDGRQLLTYDHKINESYILEGGDYYVAFGVNAHDAVNNILAAKGGAQDNRLYGEGNAAYAKAQHINEDTSSYGKSPYDSSVAITNQFASADLSYYEDMCEDDPDSIYLSRKHWNEFPTTNVKLSMTEELALDLTYDKEFEENPNLQMPTYGAQNNLRAYDLKDCDFNHELWDKLLDQMSWEEQALLCSNAYHRIEGVPSVSLNQAITENGPVGLTNRSDFPKQHGADYVHVSYPCGPIQGATWNENLLENMGRHIGEDLLYTGYQGIYGPGLNLHRTAFGGRAWEYPSEDSYLSGIITASSSRGIESKGCTAYVKHFVMNDLETNRRHVGIWANEQTIRELYLLPYEMVFTPRNGVVAAHACMNSFTRLGATWCGASKELLINVLRKEWGWTGIMISDWDTKATMSKIDGILGGTDSFDGNNNASAYAAWKNSPTVAHALRQASKHIIYTMVHTNLMNGVSASSRVIPVTPLWQSIIIYSIWGTAGLTLLFGALMVVSLVRKPKQQ